MDSKKDDRVSSQGGRKFYELPSSARVAQGPGDGAQDPEQLASFIRDQVVGRDTTFVSPFGIRKIVYCDFVASGRSLKFIENYVTAEILPTLSDGHTMTTVTGLQTALYFDETKYGCNM